MRKRRCILAWDLLMSKMFASKGERATVRVEASVVLLNCSVACEKVFFRREVALVEEMRTKSKKQANRGGHAPESEREHAWRV